MDINGPDAILKDGTIIEYKSGKYVQANDRAKRESTAIEVDYLDTEEKVAEAVKTFIEKKYPDIDPVVLQIGDADKQLMVEAADRMMAEPVTDIIPLIMGMAGGSTALDGMIEAELRRKPHPNAIRKGGKEPSRNAPCPCGSGIKYKRCCASEQQQKEQEAMR